VIAKANPSYSLVADLGGTRIRIALVHENRIENAVTWLCSDFPDLASALGQFLKSIAGDRLPAEAAIAVACPVDGDTIELTNRDWSFSVSKLQRELGLRRLVTVNDFSALSIALPCLSDNQTREIKPGIASAADTLAVLGPGTGLGVGVCVRAAGHWLAIASEGGHRDLAATNYQEWAIVDRLRRELEHVSAERVLSGPGLVNLYRAICGIDGAPFEDIGPDGIVALSRSAESVQALQATDLFSSWLGGFAGDLALTIGARGGVFVGGGVVPRMGDAFKTDLFVERFLDKGRFRDYLEPIPVRLLVDPYVALIGLGQILEDQPIL
jgi:glucokinase